MLLPVPVSILCNPYQGERFRLEEDALVGVSSGQRFRIQNGIPSFLNAETIPRRNHFYRWFYDRTAFAYDLTIQLGSRLKIGTEETVRRQLVNILEINPGDKVLETAAGTAMNLRHLPPDADYFGLDISWNMLQRAKRNLARWGRAARLFHADAQFLPFEDGAFDAVFQMGGLQFIADPFKATREMARVAGPGATITILDEISGAERMFRRLPAHAPHAVGRANAIQSLTRLVPHGCEALQADLLPTGEFYLLSFKNHK